MFVCICTLFCILCWLCCCALANGLMHLSLSSGRYSILFKTIASLLAGLYSPTSGNIVVRGESGVTNFNDLDSETLSKLVQVVPQDPALFDATILENVRYSCPEASLENVKQALTSANCDDFISKLEGGLDYQVGR